MMKEGCWRIRLTKESGIGSQADHSLEGIIRVSLAEGKLQLSGDLYLPLAGEDISHLEINNILYPTYQVEAYKWYLRSYESVNSGNQLIFCSVALPWQNFYFNDGHHCVFRLFDSGNDERMEGRLSIYTEGLKKPGLKWRVSINWVSCYQRGCLIDVDDIQEINWSDIRDRHGSVSLVEMFREHGIDLHLNHIGRKDKNNEPDYTEALIHFYTRECRNLFPDSLWRIRLLIDRNKDTSRLKNRAASYGEMVDLHFPSRELVVIYGGVHLLKHEYIECDYSGKQLQKVPRAFLRVVAHELGHGLNQEHRVVEEGQRDGFTLMFITNDIVLNSEEVQFPGSALFSFEKDQKLSLMHDPDPKIAPGWMDFEWGYGSNNRDHFESKIMRVFEEKKGIMRFMKEAYRKARFARFEIKPVVETINAGGSVLFNFTLENRGIFCKTAPARLDTASAGLLYNIVRNENESDRMYARSLAFPIPDCGSRELYRKDKMNGQFRLFATNKGFIFDRPGSYQITVCFGLTDNMFNTFKMERCVYSNAVTVEVKDPDQK